MGRTLAGRRGTVAAEPTLLIRASAAQNRYIGIESLAEEGLSDLRERCAMRARADRIESAQDASDEAEAAANKCAARAAERAAGLS